MIAYHATTPASCWRDLARVVTGVCRARALWIAAGLERDGVAILDHPEAVDWRGDWHPPYRYCWWAPGEARP